MRVAISTWNLRRVGGIESYIGTVIPELVLAGCQVALLGEVDVPAALPKIASREIVTWCVAELGHENAMEALREWNPDVIFMNGAAALQTQRSVLEIAPTVFYAHGYHGTCISGAKSFKFPKLRPCHRQFGAMCLVHYFPHRCGGLNPITLVRRYRQAREQARLIPSYCIILTNSSYLAAEYLEHGLLEASRVNVLHYPIGPSLRRGENRDRSTRSTDCMRLLFAGRMTVIKGGQLLIGAMSRVVQALGRPVKLILAGDGPERRRWEHLANRAMATDRAVRIEFAGWLDRLALNAMLDRIDLLVVPSLWPEPFGLIGPEAGLHGVPQAAFSVGGISEWLDDGVNGYLAPGEPPTTAGLAEAIVKCLRDPAEHERLCRGAVEVASRFTVQRHLQSLLGILEKAGSSWAPREEVLN